jgi:hypothetical protein
MDLRNGSSVRLSEYILGVDGSQVSMTWITGQLGNARFFFRAVEIFNSHVADGIIIEQ